jgi:hypothetical protein
MWPFLERGNAFDTFRQEPETIKLDPVARIGDGRQSITGTPHRQTSP